MKRKGAPESDSHRPIAKSPHLKGRGGRSSVLPLFLIGLLSGCGGGVSGEAGESEYTTEAEFRIWNSSADGREIALQILSPLEFDQVHWKFGDGATSDEPAPVHRYGAAGSYVVELTLLTSERVWLARARHDVSATSDTKGTDPLPERPCGFPIEARGPAPLPPADSPRSDMPTPHQKRDTAVVTGRVGDEEGVPWAGVRVHAAGPEGEIRRTVITDSEGRFLLTIPAMNADLVLMAVAPECAEPVRCTLQRPLENEVIEVELSLPRAQRTAAHGRIVDSSGSPVPRHSFELKSQANLTFTEVIRTDDSGYFVSNTTPKGRLLLRSLEDPSLTVEQLELTPPEAEPREIPVGIGELTLGIEVDPLLFGSGMIRLELHWAASEDHCISRCVLSTRFEASERLTWQGLPRGEYQVHVRGSMRQIKCRKSLSGDDCWNF